MEQRKITPFVSTNVNQVAQRDVGFWDSAAATYGYNYGPISRYAVELFEFGNDEFDQTYNWEKDIEGYEEDVEFLSGAKNPEHMQYLKQSLEINRANRDSMERGSFFGIMTASIVDPLNIAFGLPVFNTGLKAAWAAKNAFGVAKEASKVGFAMGIAQEALRVPFDPLATPAEVGTNLISTTVGSGLLVGGLRGGANLIQPRVKKGLDVLQNYAYDVGGVPKEYKGVPIINTSSTSTTNINEIIVYDLKGNPIKATIIAKSDKGAVKVKLPDGSEEVVNNGTVFQDSIYDGIDINGVNTNALNKKDATTLLKSLEAKLKAFVDKGVTAQLGARDLILKINALKIRLKVINKQPLNKPKGPTINQKSKTRPDGSKIGARFSREDNKIYWDEDYIKSQFDLKPWTKPKVKGVSPLPENAFNTPEDWARFVLHHEMSHVDMPYEAMKKAHAKNNAGASYSRADYENDINNMALERHYKGYGLKQTAATKAWFYKAITTPQKRILNDPSLPNEIKYNIARSFYNASLDLEGNPSGKGVQSLAARALTYGADSYNLDRDIKLLWRQETKGFAGGGDIFGFNLDNARVKIGSYGQNARTFEEYYQNIMDLIIDEKSPMFNKSILNNLPKTQIEAMQRMKKFFKDFEQDGRAAGVLGDDASIRGKIAMYKESVALRKEEIQKLRDKNDKNLDSQIEVKERFLEAEEAEITYLQGVLDTSINKDFAIPIYYNKALLRESEQAKEELTVIFTDHLLSGGKHSTWNDANGTWTTQRVTKPNEARNIAEQIVDRIIEDPDTGNFVPRSGKGKHLMRRALDIPEWKIKNYIVRDPRIVQNYANKMGFRIEWALIHGKMDIDDLLNRHEEIMRLGGKHSEDRIAEVRRDTLGDYEREAGIHVRNPDAWNQTVIRNLKSVAGMTYLPLAGLTSIIDAVGMPIFEYGFGAVAKNAMRVVDGDFAQMRLNGKQVRYGNEAMEILKPIVQYRVLTDSVRDLQPKLVERTIQGAERGFYLLNLLSGVTSIGKQIDTAFLIPEFFDRITRIKNNGKVTKFEMGELARYGITEQLAKELADMPWGKTDSGMPTLDLASWPTTTFQDRRIKRTMAAYLAQHARNTIMHSTSGDRPLIMDGFTYVKWKPWMKTFGLEIDDRASTANVKFARVENAFMGMPFQFLNFAFAANNRIFAASLDPARQHRLSGVVALLGMSYLALKLKKDDWWFENKDFSEILLRTVDQSGIGGLYTDIAYHAIHTAIAGGMHNPDNSWLKGKYKPTMQDDLFDKMGAVPSMLSEWVRGAYEMTTGNTMEGLRDLTYHVPILGLSGLADDVRSFTRQ